MVWEVDEEILGDEQVALGWLQTFAFTGMVCIVATNIESTKEDHRQLETPTQRVKLKQLKSHVLQTQSQSYTVPIHFAYVHRYTPHPSIDYVDG